MSVQTTADSLIKFGPEFLAYGIVIGGYVALTFYLLLLGLYQGFIDKRRYASLLFISGAISTSCFALFNLYSISVYFEPVKYILPHWLLTIGKVAIPIGIYFNFVMYIQSIPIKTLESYLIWHKSKRFYPFFYLVLIATFLLLVFVDNVQICMFMALTIVIMNAFFGAVFTKMVLKNVPLSRTYGDVLLLFVLILMCLLIAIVFFNPESFSTTIFIYIHLMLGILVLTYTFLLTQYIIDESLPYAEISRFNINGFYKNVYHALNFDEFFIEYQPKITLSDMNVCGVEALVRWNHPDDGLVSPNDFIPMAEKTEIINHICHWVVDKVCTDIAELRKQGILAPVSINFSVADIYPEMVHFLLSNLQKHHLTTKDIIIEITESLFLDMSEKQKQAISMIHDSGIKISLDDFGAGYSSLRHLDEMSLSEIKVDKDLINRVLETKKHTVILTIMQMCHTLGIAVVAEGINDDETRKVLIDMDCDMGQGYGICPPMQMTDFLVWMLGNNNQQRKGIQ